MRAEIARGAAWMVLFRLFDRSIGVVSTTLLARLLMPADFGLVAMAMSVIAIIELATAFSFDIALIQKPDPQRAHYDTAWTLNILMAMIGSALTSLLAYPAAAFYGDPRIAPVTFAIAAAWLVSGFENIATVNFRRDMNFGGEFRFLATKRVFTFAVTITAAVMFRSYWALVIGTMTGRVIGVILSYVMQPFRPRLTLACSRELFSFSGWMLANNIISVLFGKLPHFFVGRVFGAQALGSYTIGSEIAQLAHTELIAPINRAMFPGYARLVDQPEAFRKICVEATAAILLVVLPVSTAIAVLAAPIVRVLLGDQWASTAPVIQVLAFSGALTALTSNNVAAYLALGRPRYNTLVLGARLVIFLAIAAAFARGGSVLTVAFAEFGAALGCLLVSLPILFASVHLRLGQYLAALWRPTVASVVGGALVHLATGALPAQGSFLGALVQLAVGLPVGAVGYLGSLWLLWLVSGRPESVETMIARHFFGALPFKPRGA